MNSNPLAPPTFSRSFVRSVLCALLASGVAALIGLILHSPAAYVSDEAMHLALSRLWIETGSFKAVLDADSPSATGPLHTAIHTLFEPFTQLSPLKIRILTLLMSLSSLGICVKCVGLWLGEKKISSNTACFVSSLFLASSAFWVCSGVAFTEFQTLWFVSLAVWIHPLTRLTEAWETSHPTRSLLFHGISGLLLGLAICGRPLVLPIVPFYLLAMYMERKSKWNLVIFSLCSLILPLLLFSYWGGFSRPSTRMFMEGPIRWEFGAYSFAYVLFMGWIINPLRLTPWKVSTPLYIFAFSCLGAALGFYYYPSVTLLKLTNLQAYETLIGQAMGGAFFGFGVYSALRILYLTFTLQASAHLRCLQLAAFVLACVPLANTQLFSTRYFLALLPFAALIFLPNAKMNYFFCLRVAAGMLLGYLCLQGYY